MKRERGRTISWLVQELEHAQSGKDRRSRRRRRGPAYPTGVPSRAPADRVGTQSTPRIPRPTWWAARDRRRSRLPWAHRLAAYEVTAPSETFTSPPVLAGRFPSREPRYGEKQAGGGGDRGKSADGMPLCK